MEKEIYEHFKCSFLEVENCLEESSQGEVEEGG